MCSRSDATAPSWWTAHADAAGLYVSLEEVYVAQVRGTWRRPPRLPDRRHTIGLLDR